MITRILHSIGYALLKWPPCHPAKRAAALSDLREYRCACGTRKPAGFPLCKPCFDALEDHDKRALSAVLRRGFVFTYLRIAKRIKKAKRAA